jgi:hypothetical protein
VRPKEVYCGTWTVLFQKGNPPSRIHEHINTTRWSSHQM